MDFEMQVIHKTTDAERKREYRAKMGDTIRAREATRMRKARADAIPEFIGVDSEGIGQGSHHRAVMLSAYDRYGNGEHYVARDLHIGLQWEEVFGFLYAQFEKHPQSAFVGFYLGYDFNQWLRSLPIKAARSLLTKEGIATRRIKDGKSRRNQERGVKCDDWEFKMMGFKRLSIRPRPRGCRCWEQSLKCEHVHLPWMHICDSGAFYQQSFLSVLNPKNWSQDPDGWPVTQEEYNIILEGKNQRSDGHLNDAMFIYNRLENIVLARIMERLAKGFQKIDIKLAKDQWYGPGASASKWLRQEGAPQRTELRLKGKHGKPLIPKWFWEACHYSYFGGWFEIFSHGNIGGESYNYDINNAYPYAASKLPHICRDTGYKRGTGHCTSSGDYVLLYCTVFTKGRRIGAVPYRDKHGNILRPSMSKGWYWRFEIDAARRAGLVSKVLTHEWMELIPCSHPAPFAKIRDLYYQRLKTGKSGAQGMAIKLNNNSVYGKFAQSVGSAPYNNWFNASYITAHCRAQILDAIATHPGGSESVLMVATDGICFDSVHPSLLVSTDLGAWEASTYTDLCLFKPGVYWHRKGLEALLEVKSRGVPRDAFSRACGDVEAYFEAFMWRQIVSDKQTFLQHMPEEAWDIGAEWPAFMIPVSFRMKTCKQALNEGHWDRAAVVQDDLHVRQDSNPQIKRRKVIYNEEKMRLDSFIHEPDINQLQTWYHGKTEPPKPFSIGFTFDGETAWGPVLEAAAILRSAPVSYDLPINPDEYEWVTVWGGETDG